MGATFLDANGSEQPMEMGCYGIGITRTAAAAIEQNHDDNGIIWPLALAPSHVHLIAVNPKDDGAARGGGARSTRELQAAGVEVLYDDRDERPGVKFKDADLIGIPFRVTVGPKSLARGAVEFKPRRAEKARGAAARRRRRRASPPWCARERRHERLLAPRPAARARCRRG